MATKEEKKPIISRTRKKASEEPKKASKSTKNTKPVEEFVMEEKAVEKAKIEPKQEDLKEEINETMKEPIIPADLSELVKPSGKIVKKTESSSRVLNMLGTVSEEILEQDARVLSQKEIDDKTYRDLLRYQKNGEILWGEIFSVEEYRGSSFKNTVIIGVLYNGVKVSIPDTVFFENTFNFGANYLTMNDREKFEKRRTMAEYQKGARICFVIKGVSRTRIAGGEFDSEYEINAVGSRTEAMEKLRDIWFIHKNRKDSSRAPREVNIGDTAKAHIISVREEYVVAECLGVETRIDAYNLNNEIVENCNDFVMPGDTILVRIKKLHINGSDVYLTVSGRLNDPSKLINSMQLNSSYLGTVDSFNDRKGTYTILLKNGVQASVRATQVEGGIDLYPGDRVSVRVKDIRPTFVVGNAIKL